LSGKGEKGRPEISNKKLSAPLTANYLQLGAWWGRRARVQEMNSITRGRKKKGRGGQRHKKVHSTTKTRKNLENLQI